MVLVGILGESAVLDRERGELVPLRSARQRQLLACLVARRGRITSTDAVAEEVWGDDLPADLTGAVHTLVSRLRRSLPAGVELRTDAAGYRLDLPDDALDAERFARLVAEADDLPPADALARLDDAAGLWRGDPYCDLDHPGVAGERARLVELHSRVGEGRARALLDGGRLADALAAARVAHEHDPLREGPVAVMMHALAATGRQVEALRAYSSLRERLVEELGVEPSEELAELERAVLLGELAAAGPPAASATSPRRSGTGVPGRASRFVGRTAETERVGALLGERRLVTLVGVAGMGKTRLACEVADAVAPDYPDGVWYLDLGTLDAAGEVPAALASALGVPDRAGATIEERLVDALGTARALLVLDGCDDLVTAAADLVREIVAGTRAVDVLATSREPLRVEGEQRWPVGPRAPDDAVDLLVDRARLLLPDWSPTGDEAATVGDLCSRLDGHPLAIELAAARLDTMTPAELVSGLDRRFRLLTRRGEPGPSRHESLHAVVEWATAPLSDDARELMERVAVFAGSFAVDDAAAVSALGFDTERVRDLLDELHERSLVEVERGPTTRFALLETLRAHGLERLGTRGRRRELEHGHARWAVDLATEAAGGLLGPDEPRWASLLDRDLAELRRAHRHLVERGDLDGALELSAALGWWAVNRMRSEALGWAEEVAALAADRAPDHPLLPKVAGVAAVGAWQRGDRECAGELARGVVERAGPDAPAACTATNVLGDLASFVGDTDEAVRRYRRAGELAAAAGDTTERVFAAVSTPMALAYGGDHDAARAAAAEALRAARRVGAPTLVAWAEYAAAEACAETDPEGAGTHARRAVELATEAGATFLVGLAGLTDTSVRARHGDPAGVLGEFPPLLEHWRRAGTWTQLWTSVRSLVDALARAGHDRDAAVLLGALRSRATAAPEFGADAARLDAVEQQLRADLGADLDLALAEGAALDDEAAVAEARRVAAAAAP